MACMQFLPYKQSCPHVHTVCPAVTVLHAGDFSTYMQMLQEHAVHEGPLPVCSRPVLPWDPGLVLAW